MWIVNYTTDSYYYASNYDQDQFKKLDREYGKMYGNGYSHSYHRTEIEAVNALREYHDDCSIVHLARAKKLTQRLKELNPR